VPDLALAVIAESSDPAVIGILARHPHVAEAREGGGPGLRFWPRDWAREVCSGRPHLDVAGLVELMDNNPLVCADEASVPDAASTLALIALGPLIRAGLLADSPTFITNAPTDEDRVSAFLQKEGWGGGIVTRQEDQDLGSVYAGSIIAEIHTPSRLEDLDDLYEEAYGRSFYVRRDETSAWDTELVQGKSLGLFRLRITVDQPHSLLTVQVMADKHGKCGAAQLVHAMNVMAGFEETLGIDGV
jgi:hypothetical protein